MTDNEKEKKSPKRLGTTKDMVFCPFFVDFRSKPNSILCQTCEHLAMFEAKHFHSREAMVEFAHDICYRSDYAKKCSHAAMMNRYYSNQEE